MQTHTQVLNINNKYNNMNDFKKGIDQTMKGAGFLEYFFGILAFICIIPVVLVYIALVKLTIQPIKWLFKKMWK